MENEGSTLDIILKIGPWIIPIGAIFVGIAIERFRGRNFVLDKNIYITKLATSKENQQIGKIEVFHDNNLVKNIFTARIELVNNSWRSIDGFDINIGFGTHNIIAGQSAYHLNGITSYTLSYSQEYSKILNNVIEEQSLPENARSKNYEDNLYKVTSHRQYKIPYINKNQKVEFEFLVKSDEDTIETHLFAEMPNLKIQEVLFHEDFKKKRQAKISYIYLFLFVLLLYPIFTYSLTPTQGINYMLLNVFGSYMASFLIYYTFSFIKSFISK